MRGETRTFARPNCKALLVSKICVKTPQVATVARGVMMQNRATGSRLRWFMSAKSGLAALAVITTGLALATSAAAGADEGAFTQRELSLLQKGELVERRVKEERNGLRLIGGTSWQVIDAPAEVVWRAVLDTGHYHRFLPQVREAKLLQEQGSKRIVRLSHGGIVGPSYAIAMHIDEVRHHVAFKLDATRPHDIRAAWGFFDLRPYGEKRSLLTFGVKADIGDGLFSALLRNQVHTWMMKVPWLAKRFIEGSGRYIYGYQPAQQTQAAR